MRQAVVPFLFSVCIAFLAFNIAGCNRSENNATDQAGEEFVRQFAEKSADDVVDSIILRSDSSEFADCAEITDSGGSSFPRTIIIDFGEGCTGLQGRTRTGVIEILMSDDLETEGAERTLVFDGYSVSPIWSDLAMGLEGSCRYVRLVSNEFGQPEFERTADLTITRGNLTIEHNFYGVRTWISGYEDPETSESLFGITGSGSSIRNGGAIINQEILDTLMYSQSCNHVTQGVLAVTRPLGSSTIDFGDGNCDDEATVTTANGNVFTLDLHRFPG